MSRSNIRNTGFYILFYVYRKFPAELPIFFRYVPVSYTHLDVYKRQVKTLEQFAEVFGQERMAAVSRELTKKFEQTVRGTLAEVADYFREHTPKGEFVIVVAGLPKPGKNMDTESEEE